MKRKLTGLVNGLPVAMDFYLGVWNIDAMDEGGNGISAVTVPSGRAAEIDKIAL